MARTSQSGLLRRGAGVGKANGLLVRGVVLTTYVVDDPSHPRSVEGPKSAYCDVYVYSDNPSVGHQILRGVSVAQERSGLHDGHIWKPRASTIDIGSSATGIAPSTLSGGVVGHNPGMLDGDHVLIGFIDGSLSHPVILRSIPHPGSNKELNALKEADGDPDYWRHHGSFYGIDGDGNFVVDLTAAHDGEYLENGDEKPAAEDGTVGNVIVRVPKGSNVTIEVDGGDVTVNTGGGKAVVEAAEVHLGADNLIPIDGVVHGTGIDSLTGATYFALGSASGVVFAKK